MSSLRRASSMNILKPSTGVVASAWTVVVALAAQTPAVTGIARQSPDKPSQGSSLAQSKAVFERLCSECHSLEDVTTLPPRSRADWEETVDKMVSMGATGSDQELAAVLVYLTAEYARVNVNKAPADEIADVLDLPARDAAAIVKYRQDKGKFEDFEGLSKVPGVDVKKLEKKKTAIAF